MSTILQFNVLRLITLVLLISACAEGEALRSKSSSLTDELKRVNNAAYRCEEKALAVARSHLDFVSKELENGELQQMIDEINN